MFSRTKYQVGLTPQAVVLSQAGKPAAPVRLPVTPQHEGDWRPAIAALAAWLTEQPAGKAGLSVLLSHRFSRSMLLPWSEERLDPAQAEAFHRSQFEFAFGDSARDWSLSIDDSGRLSQTLASAMPTELLGALQGVGPAVRLESVMPWWVSAYDKQCRQLPAEGWFAAVEPGCLVLLELAGGRVQQPTLHEWDGDWEPVLARAVRRAGLRSMREENLPVVVCNMEGRT